eukprot:1196241-Prorocentrum_minimum.AAC.2
MFVAEGSCALSIACCRTFTIIRGFSATVASATPLVLAITCVRSSAIVGSLTEARDVGQPAPIEGSILGTGLDLWVQSKAPFKTPNSGVSAASILGQKQPARVMKAALVYHTKCRLNVNKVCFCKETFRTKKYVTPNRVAGPSSPSRRHGPSTFSNIRNRKLRPPHFIKPPPPEICHNFLGINVHTIGDRTIFVHNLYDIIMIDQLTIHFDTRALLIHNDY